ncbi:MAG TPA: bacillithiol system redox-active protein YtxJ [Pyrinomonadaceae bacterium]|jgi:bacillithiol system protein YtxJ|nr:bacillithiol system redox-active protein YtxJ [Pyrinomonadaceae bacterium]
METDFNAVRDAGGLEELFARSNEEPVLIFKHSNSCPISAQAYRQMKQYKGDVSLIVVQQARDVSQAIEQRTGLRHESPQALILRGGRVVWNASHFDITAAAVERAMQEAAQG